MQNNTNQEFRGDMLVLLAMAMFGSYSLFLLLCPQIPTLTFLFAFQIVGAVVFSFLSSFGKVRGLGKRDCLLFLALAAVALANDLLYFLAFRSTTVANAAVAHQSVSFFLLFLAPLLLHEKTQRNELIALAISIVGVVVLYSNGIGFGDKKSNLLGITLGVASGFFYALLILLYRIIPNTERGITIRVVNFWRYLFASALLMPFMPTLGYYASFGRRDLIPLVGFGLLFAVVASGIHHFGINRTRSLHVSILGKSEPVFAVIYALLILGQIPAVQTIVGGLLIVGSSVWLTLSRGEGE